jgi:predicted neuraminidase
VRVDPLICALAAALSAFPPFGAGAAASEPSSELLRSPGIVKAEFIFEEAPFGRCHASTIAETGEGLVAAWFGGSQEGHSDVGIWIARQVSSRWSKPAEVATGASPDGKRYPCWNPVLFSASNNLLLFYKVGPSPETWWGMLIRSADSGRTWSQPERLPDGILGPAKNKPVMLADGRLLCGSSTEVPGWQVQMEWTSDTGRTWEKTKPLGDSGKIGAIQPAILKHGNDKLQIICRTNQGHLSESWSNDGGRTWTEMKLTELPNPNSGIDAVTLRDGRHLLVYNPTTLFPNKGVGPRAPLSVAVSEDGKQWKAALKLEGSQPDDPLVEYSYPAVIQTTDGLVHVTYTWKRLRIKHVVIDPSKLRLRDL